MNDSERILIIIDECGPGDAARIGFCLSAVREAHPMAEIVLMVGERAAPVVERSPLFDRVVVSRLYGAGRRGRMGKGIELMRLVRRLGPRYDLILTFWWGSSALNLLAWALGRRRIGFSNRLPGLHTTDIGRYDPFGDPVQQNLAILYAAGINAVVPTSPGAVHDEADMDSVRDLLDRFAVPRSRPLVVLHPGSDWACQQWLPERWAEMADSLSDLHGVSLVFSGVAEESAYIENVRRRMHAPSVSLAGRTTVSQLGALVAQAQLCVCVDSMIYELAQAAGTPTVVLAGPTRPHPRLAGRRPPLVVNRSSPELRLTILRCQQQYPEGVCHRYECPMSGLREIAVRDVLAEIEASGVLSGAEVGGARA